MQMSVNDTLQLCLVLIAVISLCYQIVNYPRLKS